MSKFQYTAVNKQGKNLSGIINADDENQARIKLNSLKLSVISITQLTTEQNNSEQNFTKFKFEGSDKEGKKVIGTIASKTILDAFKKLTTEYELKVFKIASINATKQEFDESVQKVSELEKLHSSLEENLVNDTSGNQIIANKKAEESLKLVEEVIATIKRVRNEFSDELRSDALEFLVKYEEHLEKIKHSDNLDNIIDAALKVLKRLEEAELFLTENKLIQEKLKLQIDVSNLSKNLKFKSNETDTLKIKLNSTLQKIGITKKTPNVKLGSSDNSQLISYLKIIFTSKSNSLRLSALKNILPEIQKLFSKNNKYKQFEKEKFTKIETELLTLSYYLCFSYLAYYFIATIITSKILTTKITNLFFLYNTKLIIYIVVLVVLFHSGLKIRQLMIEHKISHSKIIYSLLSILFAIIIINL